VAEHVNGGVARVEERDERIGFAGERDGAAWPAAFAPVAKQVGCEHVAVRDQSLGEAVPLASGARAAMQAQQGVAMVGARGDERGMHEEISVRHVPGRGATVGAARIAPMSARRSHVVARYPGPAPCIRRVIARYPQGNAGTASRSHP